MKSLTVSLAALALAGLAIVGCRQDAQPTATSAESAREALAVPDAFERSVRWQALLEHAGPDDAAALREAIARAPLDTGDPEVVAFAMWWARFDPEAALAWTDAEWRARSRLVVGGIFRMWAYADPDAAVDGVAKIAQFHHEAALDAVIAGWTESRKPGLLEKAVAMPDDAARQRFGEMVARRLVLARGADEAMRMIEAVDAPGWREMMAVRIASAAAEQGDGSSIAAWAASRVTSGDEQPSGYPRRIGTRWILSDPEGALAWLKSLPAGADRDDGVMESYRDWARYAPGPAFEWARTTPIERWSEPAISIYARLLGRDDPEQALALLSRLTDDELRIRVTTVVARKWAARDRAAADAWLAKADLPDDVKARVTAGLPTRPNPLRPVRPQAAQEPESH
jgi:hypothetical protein